MQAVDIHEAKIYLSRLIKAIEGGKEIVIARAGHPVATLLPYQPPHCKIAPPGTQYFCRHFVDRPTQSRNCSAAMGRPWR